MRLLSGLADEFKWPLASIKKQDQKLRKIASSILKRENEWLEVQGYKLGDIQTELTVNVTKEAAIAGNVLAPRVIVAGIIYGFVASREVVVESTGQIWGDVHSVALEIAPGGKLHGWMSTLDEGTVDLLRSGELSTVDLDETGQRTIPQEILDILPGDVVSLDGREAEPRLLIWRQLRAEAAMALLARSEIEATFERRLSELVNSTSINSASEKELESELIRMRKLSRTAIEQATDYHNRYLMAQKSLEEAQKALAEQQKASMETELASAGKHKLGKSDLAGRLGSDLNRDEQMASLRMALVEQEIELKKARDNALLLANQLKETRRLATNRIRKLETELGKRK
ncbi:MAG: hypothetical protein AMJ56_00145 [Anaerolineae bacterium SG8_19]|jgi:cytoskeletal protein CcmA (bactofilin family)|nr:MAG: hypothetical protein AMJ56_00145 [Anaerolineae bacterium SG8_19]